MIDWTLVPGLARHKVGFIDVAVDVPVCVGKRCCRNFLHGLFREESLVAGDQDIGEAQQSGERVVLEDDT